MFRLRIIFIILLCCCLHLSATKKVEKPPIWVTSPSTMYSESEYIVELGNGLTQNEADNKAIEGLASIFNRSISSKTDSSLKYYENAHGMERITNIDQKILVSTSIKDLIGVEIKERWKSKDGGFYALAVLNRHKAIFIYSEKARLCASVIAESLNISSEEKGTFHEYFRYVSATSKAYEMSLYNAYLSVLSPASSFVFGKEYNPDKLKLETSSIAKNILVEVRLGGNFTDARFRSIFEKVFTSRGFTIAKSKNGRYILDVDLELEKASKLSEDRLMIRYSLTSELVDSVTGDSLLPFVINDKAVNFSSEALKNQIFKDVKKKVEKDFDALFSKYMEDSFLE